VCMLLRGPHLLGPGRGLGRTHRLLFLLWCVSDRRGEWGVVFPLIGLPPATEAVAGSGLGVMRVEQVLVGFE
jgi:hypothetical protein